MSQTPSLLRNPSFLGLTATQFLATINDHLFKMAVSLFAIGTAAETAGVGELSLTSALFVLPYLLLSGYAGALADRVPRHSVLKAGSFADVLIMCAGVVALVHSDRVGGMLFVLVLMATQATFFSPSKYGSIPDMVPPGQLTRANGILEASRYAAVILGAVTGGVLMQLWRETPLLIGLVAMAIAVVEFFCSLAIARLPAVSVERSRAEWPWTGVCSGIRALRHSPSLAIAVASLSFFEFLAALVVMDTLLLAKMNLGVEDAQAGMLAGFAAIGSGAGALLSTRLSRPKAELGAAPIAGLGIGCVLVALALGSYAYGAVAALLILLGISSGAFFVPFLAWLQKSSARDARGLVISTNNFMNMLGVLTAAGALWSLSRAGLSPREILGVSAILTFAYVGTVLLRSPRIRTHLLRRIPALRRAFPRHSPELAVLSTRENFRVPTVARIRVSRAAIILVSLAFVTALTGTASAEEQRHLTYRIRHERLGEIGSLTQDIRIGAEGTAVVTRINVHASLFGVTLRRMESEWREQWQDGLLRSFAGTSTADGATLTLSGEAAGDSFVIRKSGGDTIAAPAQVQPVNPWSLQFTRASTFMSPETGRITEARIVDEGMQPAKVNGRSLMLHRYRAGFEGDHELYFDDSGTLLQFAYAEFGGKLVVTLQEETQ